MGARGRDQVQRAEAVQEAQRAEGVEIALISSQSCLLQRWDELEADRFLNDLANAQAARLAVSDVKDLQNSLKCQGGVFSRATRGGKQLGGADFLPVWQFFIQTQKQLRAMEIP